MKFIIDQRVFELFPDLAIGVVIVCGVDNTGEKVEVMQLIKEAEQGIVHQISLATLAVHPKIVAWQNAYRAFGAKPKDHVSSVENLYRRALTGKELRHINTLVDCYNYLSLKYMLPVGGEDVDAVQGDIRLTRAESHEPPVLLLGDNEPRAPHEGEIIYRDDVGAICRRFNWREADRTKLTEETKNAVLAIEGLLPVLRSEIEGAVDELKNCLQRHCGGDTKTFILDINNPTASW
ncbi:MAG: phenylalanine--tRNA ligase beta subunit-related protein [Patescibacteria group bacterium]